MIPWVLFVVSSLLATRADAGGLNQPHAVGPYLNGAFPNAAPAEITGWTTVNAFPNLTFYEPLQLSQVPGENQMLLVCKNGRIFRFPKSSTALQSGVVQVLDWTSKTQTGEDMGFYGATFHPEFGQAGSPNTNYVYVCYSHRPGAPLTGQSAFNTYWTVSRFTWDRPTGTLNPASEYVMIRQYDPHSWHNGGAMFFGPDGFLYITTGDGGGGSDAYGYSQRINFGLFGGILRIDVNNDPAKSHPIRRQPASDPLKPSAWYASYTQGYSIPNDNPWQATNGSILEEFYAIGLRSPHTAHHDPVTGEIWVGDVGHQQREEMTAIIKGDNAQWAYREGNMAGIKATPTTIIGNPKLPALDYPHSNGNACVIGGMRYRGAKWANELGGKLIYADHASRRVWTATFDGTNPPVITQIINSFSAGGFGLASFFTDDVGDIYMVAISAPGENTGVIHKLAPQGITADAPALLSQTGFFTNLANLTPIPAAIPVSVASPLWSDGTDKHRWLVVPNDGVHNTPAEKIVFSENDSWVLPAGSLLVKHFERPLDERNPSITKRLETRFVICTPNNGKYGITYKWNAAGTDAVLMTSGLVEYDDVILADGSTVSRKWDYPARGDCMRCHNEAAGQALGVNTHQLNHDLLYPATGRSDNQLGTLNALGMFDVTLTPEQIGDFLAARDLKDETAPLEHRVRSYLDANCSYCHRPDGPIHGFDARLVTPLSEQGLIDADITGRFSLPGGKYIKSGDPLLSAIRVRMASATSPTAMPPLAKNLAHGEAVQELDEYISGLNGAEFQTTPGPLARYVSLTGLSEVNNKRYTSVAEFTILDDAGEPLAATVDDWNSEEIVGEYAPAEYAADGDPNTYWHTQWRNPAPFHPHYITLDLGAVKNIGGFEYLPRQGPLQGDQNGRIKNYEIHYSVDGNTWFLLTSGVWPNTADTQRYDGAVQRRAPRTQIAGPATHPNEPFEVTVTFDMNVNDLTPADFNVTGGTVTALRGKGYYYVATVTPAAANVSVAVAEDAVDPDGAGSLPSTALAVTAAHAYNLWAQDFQIDQSNEGFIIDSDKDGIANLLEFAFNLNPTQPDQTVYSPEVNPPHGLPKTDLSEPARLSFSFPRRRNVPGLVYQAQFADTPDSFQDVTTPPSVQIINDDWEVVTITDDTPAGKPARFGRVKVSLARP